MGNKNICYYANLANKILTSSREGKQYFDDREVIKLLFISNDWKLNNYDKNEQKQKIKARLTLIDSYYSTNVGSRRYDGIDEIVNGICEISNSDDELVELFVQFVKNINSTHKIGKLLNATYGWSKSHINGLRANSLISKYGYFLTDYKFPIIDKYVKQYHTRIIKYFNLQKEFFATKLPKNDSELSLLKRINSLNMPIQNYEKMDNLLWLTGKIANSNFSLILNKEKHMQLIRKLKNEDRNINEYIYDEDVDLSNIFSSDLIEFIKFVKEIVK